MLAGHLCAIAAAVGFAWSTTTWWGGLLMALGVAGNHFADCIDGTHARSTGQCRNGGELLDHFTDPLSFAYWIFGWAVAVERLELGITGVIVMYATAVLTNIKAKLLGEFTLATFGPTEFKSGLVVLGIVLSVAFQANSGVTYEIAHYALLLSVFAGATSLLAGLGSAVVEVNQKGAPPDTTEWDTVRSGQSEQEKK